MYACLVFSLVTVPAVPLSCRLFLRALFFYWLVLFRLLSCMAHLASDISDFVAEQRANAVAPYDRLVTPREEVYPIMK